MTYSTFYFAEVLPTLLQCHEGGSQHLRIYLGVHVEFHDRVIQAPRCRMIRPFHILSHSYSTVAALCFFGLVLSRAWRVQISFLTLRRRVLCIPYCVLTYSYRLDGYMLHLATDTSLCLPHTRCTHTDTAQIFRASSTWDSRNIKDLLVWQTQYQATSHPNPGSEEMLPGTFVSCCNAPGGAARG